MRGEVDFQKYSHVVGEGLFADNVILSIIGYNENGVLSPKEKEVLKRASEFLDDVIAGGRLQNSILRSAHDITAVKAYYSVQPLTTRNRVQNVVDYITELRNTIDELLNDNRVEESKVKQVDNFFSNHSRIHFQKAKSVLETV